MKTIVKSISHYLRIIGAAQALEVILTLFSLAMSIISLFAGKVLLLILSICAIAASLVVLAYSIRASHNKQLTLYSLSEQKRYNSVRMLMIHDSYLTVPRLTSSTYRASHLVAESCSCEYKLIHIPNKDEYDITCTYRFRLLKNQKPGHFSVMAMQSRGDLPSISYRFSKTAHTIPLRLDPREFEENFPWGFSGVLIGNLHTPEDMHSVDFLEVTISLHGYSKNIEASMIFCPFFYVKSLKSYNVNFDFSCLNSSMRPRTLTLFQAPYDGSRGGVNSILDLTPSVDFSKWSGSVSKDNCKANALYILTIKR